MSQKGRPKEPGKYFRFGLRYRPGLDPPELGTLLESIHLAPMGQRESILRAALLGGAAQGNQVASREDHAAAAIVDDIFADF